MSKWKLTAAPGAGKSHDRFHTTPPNFMGHWDEKTFSRVDIGHSLDFVFFCFFAEALMEREGSVWQAIVEVCVTKFVDRARTTMRPD